jgi:hypothetical protein
MLKYIPFLYSYFAIHSICALTSLGCRSMNDKCEDLQITSFYVANSIDSSIVPSHSKPFARHDNFLVCGFENTERNIIQIDSFVCSKKVEVDSILKLFENYSVSFYRIGEITNNIYIKENERDLARYSTQIDLLYVYRWNQAGFLGRFNRNAIAPTNKSLCD